MGRVPLKLVTGPANAGKAGVVFGGYRAALHTEPVLVVPAFRDVEHAQRELAGRGAVFGTRVVRFRWLFEIVAERCGSESLGAPLASGLQRELIVERAVEGAGLEVLAGSARRPGLRAGGRPHDPRARAVDGHPPAVRPGARRVGGRRPAARVRRRGRVDLPLLPCRPGPRRPGRRRALRVARARSASRTARRVGRRAVFVYGFDDFTPHRARR